jgi:3-hydroxy-3-methylglutaryl CoA synthase
MIGIAAVGAFVSRYRLSGKTLASVWGAGGGGERAVAGYDEDSLTMAAVADLGPAVLSADFGASLRCGTTALRLALDTVKAGNAAEALVAAADLRPVAPGTPEEAQIGDGAGAVLVGGTDLIAVLSGCDVR